MRAVDSPELKAAPERFAKDTADHEMTVLRDDGLYRHLRFQCPEKSGYWFELLTAPGSLTFMGAGEAFVFRCTKDMFGFFRSNSTPKYPINPGYWDEKLVSDRHRAYEYSITKFEELAKKELAEVEQTFPGVTKAWDKKISGFWAEYNTEYEDEARRAVHEFAFGAFKGSCTCGGTELFDDRYDSIDWKDEHTAEGCAATIEEQDPFGFTDVVDWDLTDYSWWYLWACHAIVWGIGQYDTAKKQDGGGEG